MLDELAKDLRCSKMDDSSDSYRLAFTVGDETREYVGLDKPTITVFENTVTVRFDRNTP